MVETTKECWYEAELNRTAGEIALKSAKPDVEQANAHFERALSIARAQQAKSWELRASMSLARLWRDQGKVQQARELLAPVYGWFTEGEGEAQRTAAAVPSPALAVPASLHASLMARLDRLGPAKEVAQFGAAIGREFSHALLGPWCANRKRRWRRRSIVSLPLVCCSGKAYLRTRLTCSSML